MKKYLVIVLALLVSFQSFGKAKYVFLFIGDGMGANTVNFTQQYLSALDGQIGTVPLCFSGFPVCSFATTFSANSGVTDSAASGTAIASGSKTNNGMLGNLPDGSPAYSIAEKARDNGMKVGIMSTVAVNHATPGAFFGHQGDRNYYDELVYDMLADGFDFYGGDGFYRSRNRILTQDPKEMLANAGYTVVGCPSDFEASYKAASKLLYVPDSQHNIQYAIDDCTAARITLRDIVSGAVEFFMKDGKCREGFFIMAEGGKIDYINHSNDAAGTIAEMLDFDAAVRYAYEFYLAHPKETAIIVTADHDTGGPALNFKNFMALANLQYQKNSQAVMTSDLISLMKQSDSPLTWDQVKGFLDDRMSLWSASVINDKDEKQLRDTYERTIAARQTGDVSDEYGYNHNAEIVAQAVKLFDHRCGIDWTTGGHSAAFVPVYYIGEQHEIFSGRFDNSFFFDAISTIARLK